MTAPPIRKAFILAACEGGPMIFSVLDWHLNPDGKTSAGGVGAQLLTDNYEPPETSVLGTLGKLALLKQQTKGDGVFAVDIGAHVGSITVPLARLMDGWGEVFAVEAQERLFYALAGNIALNNLWNARALWGAVADHPGILEGPIVDYTRPTNLGGISMIPKNNADASQKVRYGTRIPAFTLDSFNLPRVDLIKIDVEGMEDQVLAGARETIKRCQPAMVIEWIKVDGGVDTIKAALPGYRVEPMGMDMLCLPVNDPLWRHITTKLEAA